jgi:integrase
VRVRLKNLHRVKKKLANGKVKIFTYLRGSRTALPGAEGSPEFMAAYYNAVTELTVKQKAAAVSDDKVMKLIANFKASSEYTGLKLKTRKDYLIYIKLIEEEFGDMPREALLDPEARKEFKTFRDKFAANARKADMVWTVLKRIFNVAIDDGLLKINPCARGGRIYQSDRNEKLWTEDHLCKLFAVCSKEIREAVITALWTGQRQGLCLRMSKKAYNQETGKIEVLVESKGRKRRSAKRMSIPVGEPLKKMLDGIDWNSDATTILTNTRGTPWTEDGFRTSFGKACQAAGIGGAFGEENDLHFHDLRGTAVTRLALAGCSVEEIAAITGHGLKTVHDMLDRHYLGGQAKLAEQAIAKLEARTKTGQIL